MNGISLTKERKQKVQSIFRHPTGNGSYEYSIHFKDGEVAWCNSISEIYLEIDNHI